MKSLYVSLFFLVLFFTSCNKDSTSEESITKITTKEDSNTLINVKLSIAQWSLHKPIFDGELDPLDFAKKAKALGFEGIEYVSQLYSTNSTDFEQKRQNILSLADDLKRRADSLNIQSLIIMVDNEGDLADPLQQDSAILKHQLWIDAAEIMGCHSIRVNLFGSENDSIQWVKLATESMNELSKYAAPKNINVIVENHGGYSCNGQLVAQVMQTINLPNCGTLPDFGNFCIRREDGARWEAPCIQEYDKYQGIKEMMPYAKAVSAKTISFDENGQETTIDYEKMLSIVYENGYDGYLGVEWESETISSEEGIKLTKDLILSTVEKLNTK